MLEFIVGATVALIAMGFGYMMGQECDHESD